MKPPRKTWLIVVYNFLSVLMRASPSFPGASCELFPRFLSVFACVRPRRRRPTAACSLFPTRRTTAMASTSAWRRATNAGPTRPIPIVNRGISSRLRPIERSIRMSSPARFRSRAKTAAVPVAKNTSLLPANAEGRFPWPIWPYWRPVKDVLPPKQAVGQADDCRIFEVHDISQHLVMRTSYQIRSRQPLLSGTAFRYNDSDISLLQSCWKPKSGAIVPDRNLQSPALCHLQ
jgi:hypothetical protein